MTTPPFTPPITPLEPGLRVDRYTIEEAIGEGGMGRVFRAHDERLDRRVALKVVLTPGTDRDEEARQRLLREARAVSRLDHPNVVSVFDVGESEHGPYIVMELVPGRSLRAAMDAGDLTVADRLRVLREIALALGAAHDAGIVHRDVKPENVIVRPDGRVKVLDFGIARAAARPVDGDSATGPGLPTLTTKGAALGTPRYMAPEQIKGVAVDGRSDQFGWGIVAHELLSGRPPFTGPDAMAVMAAVLTEEPPPLRDVPPALAALVERALAKDPARRFATMHDLVAELDRAPSVAAPAQLASAPPPAALSPSLSPSPPPRVAAPHPLPPQLSRHWSARELEEIFDRALSVQRTGYGYGEIVAAAREIGVDDTELSTAMAHLENRGAVKPRPQRRAAGLRGFHRHAGIWLAVSMGLFLMNVFDRSSVWWFQWTMISWGIGVAVHAVVALTRGPGAHKPGRRSKDAQLEGDAARVATYLEAKHDRVRVATGGRDRGSGEHVHVDDLDAELEALAAEETGGRRGRRRR